jgi:hypothetical protein
MVRLLRAAAFATAIALSLVPAAGAASAPQCGDVVGGDLVLTADLVCSGDGLTVASDADVTVDLNGHSIVGSGTGVGLSVVAFGTNTITVRNGTIRGFDRGVSTGGSGGNNTPVQALDHLFVARNGTGATFFGGTTILSHSTVAKNELVGVHDDGTGLQRMVDDVVRDNGGDGIEAFEDSLALLRDSFVAHNGGRGLRLSDSVATITGNTFLANGGTGLAISERFCDFSPYTISDNVADRNGGGGMSFVGTSSCAPLDPGVPSGSGNAAKNNATFQCVLIVCARNRGQARHTGM